MRSSPPVPPDEFIRVSSPTPQPQTAVTEINPWLQPRVSSLTQPRRKNEILIGKDSTGADKSKNQMKKRLMKGDEEREKARDDAVVEISMDEVLKLPSEPSPREESQVMKANSADANSAEKGPPNGKQVDAAFEDSDVDSEIEAQERQTKVKGSSKGIKAFKQRDLVALAFAGDNVVQV